MENQRKFQYTKLHSNEGINQNSNMCKPIAKSALYWLVIYVSIQQGY